MPKIKKFDSAPAHRFFSVDCFNRTWSFIDKKKRTPKEDIVMVAASFASYWHWIHRPDCKPVNISIAYWQLSRVFALLKDANNALKLGKLCLDASRKKGIEPFYLAYAYEALARAEMTAKNKKKMREYLKKAKVISEKIKVEEYKGWLLADLKTIK